MDWRTIDYLKHGTPRQCAMYEVLQKSCLLEQLHRYDPAVVSTICVDVDIDSSDIDVSCSCALIDEFVLEVTRYIKSLKREGGGTEVATLHRGYQHSVLDQTPIEFATLSFNYGGFAFEIFGCNVATHLQYSYRHLSVLYQLVQYGGDGFKELVRQEKLRGLKTEAAISKVLNLTGDPFAAVLALERCSSQTLTALVARNLQ